MADILLKERYEKELVEKNKLIEKRNKLDLRIKESQAKINRLETELNQQELSETQQILKTQGLSLAEILTAIQNKDLSSINNKLNACQSS